MKNKKSSKKKNSSLFTIALVVLAFIILLLIFLVKKDQILSNFKDTRFFDRVFGATPEFVQNHESAPKEEEKNESETITLNILKDSKEDTKKSDNSNKDTEIQKSENKESVVVVDKEEKSVTSNEKSSESTKTESFKETQKQTTEVRKVEEKKPESLTMTEYQVCFVYIDPDGSILRKMVKKSVPKNDSPLTSAVNLLLKGPDTTKNAEKNFMTLIPEGTKLLSAKVQNGVAFLNFSNDFEVNGYGIDGFQGQLMQVVYTATAFSTVNSVQFLIEGEKREYLSEGIWIGSPLSRSNF